VAGLLHRMGAIVRVVDDHVDPALVPAYATLVPLCTEQVEQADAVVLLTDHDDVDYDLLDQARLVFDTRNRLRVGAVERL
jgi:UDP-N-acetyl-D-mannosaminuronate dehydrogenase